MQKQKNVYPGNGVFVGGMCYFYPPSPTASFYQHPAMLRGLVFRPSSGPHSYVPSGPPNPLTHYIYVENIENTIGK